MRLPGSRRVLLLSLFLAGGGVAAAPAGGWAAPGSVPEPPQAPDVPPQPAWGVPPAAASHGPGIPPDTVPTAEEVVRLLSTAGSREEGMRAITLRAGSLPPARGTLWIQLLATVERTGEEAGALASRAVARADDRDPGGGVTLLMEGVGGAVPEGDRAALVALGAHLLSESEAERAAELRRRLLREWPEALEAPEAQVELARHLLARGGAGEREEAVELLESLLVRRPSHPLAPEARRLRQEALRSAPGGTPGAAASAGTLGADPGTGPGMGGRMGGRLDPAVELNLGEGGW